MPAGGAPGAVTPGAPRGRSWRRGQGGTWSVVQRKTPAQAGRLRCAITLYEFIDAQMRAGRDVLIRDNETGETQVIRLL